MANAAPHRWCNAYDVERAPWPLKYFQQWRLVLS
eukprot:CAMPEP_0115207548 /NCGR_PEP_ID=MMETSP0270-20121206/20772_1 /TAXON_ID=71861 /ORGANISM="Scrippsiella trochoidea, Strain CCMP3099" /LENGTH=33 /DNA_ID= /DNA_START= /DNA_END= /DNA_ORIENTATION=